MQWNQTPLRIWTRYINSIFYDEVYYAKLTLSIVYIYIYIYIYIYTRGVFNKLLEFVQAFVQAFKIGVDTWKFTMLLQ